WYKLHSKAGKKEKERGEIQVGVQFSRNPLSASMFDLSAKDKTRSSPFGRLKDKVTGRKRFELESASAIVPGSAALGGTEPAGPKAKAKTFFLRHKLRKSSLTQSNTSLGSDSTLSSASGSPAWPGPDYLTRSPSRHSRLSTDGRDSAPSPKLLTHKRAYSDEVSQVQAAPPRGLDAVSGSSLCINGSHVYCDEPPAPAAHRASISGPVPCSGVLQGLRRAEEGAAPPDTGPWARGGLAGSSDTLAAPGLRREEAGARAVVEDEAEAGRAEGKPVQAAATIVPASTEREEPRKEERRARVGLFHHHHHTGRRGSLGEKMGPGPGASPEDRGRSGWFGSREGKEHTQKPSLDVSPQVESGPAVPAPPPPPGSPPCSPPAPRMLSANLAPAAAPPAPRGLGPTNPFLPSLQSNPFFEELVADTALKRSSPARSLPSGSLAAALPPWDDAFDAVAAGGLPPRAGSSAPSGAPRTPECPEDPRGGGGGPTPDLKAAGARSPDSGRREALAGVASPMPRGPGPSLSASWHSPSWDPEVGGTLSWGPAPPSPPRRASCGKGGSPGPGVSEEPEEGAGGVQSHFSPEMDGITDIWASEMVSGIPGPESPPPIPRRNWEREGSLWGAPDAAPTFEEPDSPGLDRPGGPATRAFALLPEELRPGSPPPKPPRLFTPSNSQSEDQEGGPPVCPEDAFLSLPDLSCWEESPGTESGLEEPEIHSSTGWSDQRAAEGAFVPEPSPPAAPPDELGPPAAPHSEQDLFQACDEDDAGSFSSPRESPASTCLPALLPSGEDAAPDPASPGLEAPQDPS
ncbi:collagen alpha-1(I) chain-like, partial [Gracilinanus agilis]|uniref:collagen alpha-1(I) chain-like n=1 Tax=Gracilinanus agilis TaxID=191870 RepID=UPI001CFE8C63